MLQKPDPANSLACAVRKILVALTCVMAASTALNSQALPSVYPTGTTRYDPAKAYNSYVLFSGGDGIARLIDLNGNTMHQWKDAAAFSTFIDPALVHGEKGHIFVTLSTRDGKGTDLLPGQTNRRISQAIGELDWDGNTVWEFGSKAPGGAAQHHHDWARLPNGNTLVLANLVHALPGFKKEKVFDDVIYEVNPAGAVVWSWLISKHLGEFGFSAAALKLLRASKSPDFLHINNMKVVGPNRWYDAGDQRFHPDNIVIDSRSANFIAIIERKTGKVAWRLGPDFPPQSFEQRPRQVPRPVDQISGQHDAHIIPAGLPGAGNLLVFDNQGEAGFPLVPLSLTGGSRILEIDPVRKEVVWQYSGEDSGQPGWSFQSTHISSARRLPNGNTLIDEGQKGRLFQVNAKGEIVWEYVSPYMRIGKDALTGQPTSNNQIYRAQPVPYEWAPQDTPRSEKPVIPPALSGFNVPATP